MQGKKNNNNVTFDDYRNVNGKLRILKIGIKDKRGKMKNSAYPSYITILFYYPLNNNCETLEVKFIT